MKTTRKLILVLLGVIFSSILSLKFLAGPVLAQKNVAQLNLPPGCQLPSCTVDLDLNSDGTVDSNYTIIQKAINNATPGSTILIDGICYERLQVNVTNLTLRSKYNASRAAIYPPEATGGERQLVTRGEVITCIPPEGRTDVPQQKAGTNPNIKIISDNVTFQGLTVAHGIEVDSENNLLKDNHFYFELFIDSLNYSTWNPDAYDLPVSILVRGENNKIVNNTIIESEESGIEIAGNFTLIKGNKLNYTPIGIDFWIRPVSDALVMENTLDRVDIGIYFWNTTNSTFKRNNATAYKGMVSHSSRSNLIVNNRYETYEYGILPYDSHSNKIANNDANGIALGGHHNNITRNNLLSLYWNKTLRVEWEKKAVRCEEGELCPTFSRAKRYKKIGMSYPKYNSGLRLSSSDHNLIKDNNITSPGYGFESWRSEFNNITNNDISSNMNHGIHFRQSHNNFILSNEIKNNTEDGIYLHNSDNNTISDNDVSFNKDNGTYLFNSHLNSITYNLIQNNTGWGVVLDGSNNNTIGNNTISNNLEGGILSTTTPYNSIISNCIANNPYGISLQGTNHEIIEGNTIVGSDIAIEMENSNFNLIVGNSLFNFNQSVSGVNVTNITVSENIEGSINATIDIVPDTLEVKTKEESETEVDEEWITAYIELPPQKAAIITGCGFIPAVAQVNVSEVNLSTVRLLYNELEIPAELKPTETDDELDEEDEKPAQIGDYDKDGVPDLRVRFNSTALVEYLNTADLEPRQNITLTVKGKSAGVEFSGRDVMALETD